MHTKKKANILSGCQGNKIYKREINRKIKLTNIYILSVVPQTTMKVITGVKNDLDQHWLDRDPCDHLPSNKVQSVACNCSFFSAETNYKQHRRTPSSSSTLTYSPRDDDDGMVITMPSLFKTANHIYILRNGNQNPLSELLG